MLRLPIVSYSVFTIGCGPALVEPIGSRPMDPGPAQVRAAHHVTTCSGRSVSASSVRWWEVEGIASDPDALGAWNPPGDVFLVERATDSELVSGHELLHHVLGGDSRHRDPLWAACGLLTLP